MKLVSKFAVAMAMGAVAIAPAAHARKEKDNKAAEAPKRDLSKEFMATYVQILDQWQKKKDLEGAKAAFPGLIAAAANDDERYETGVLILNFGIEQKDQAIQLQGIDQLLMSSVTTPEQRGVYLFQKGAVAFDGKDYPQAENFMKQAHDNGYRRSNIEYLIANAQAQQAKYGDAMTWLRKAIDAKSAAGETVDVSWYAQGANFALKSKDDAAANLWLKDLLRVDGKPAYWHDALTIFITSNDFDLQEKLDVMRLMRLTDAMLYEQDFATYLESVNPARYPDEAYSMLEEGFNKGVINRNTITFAEEWKVANGLLAESKANAALTEKDARNATDPYQAILGAEVFLSRRDYAVAAELYARALSMSPQIKDRQGVDQTDRSILRLAISQIGIGKFDDAAATLAKITSGDRNKIAEYWKIYIDKKKAEAAPAPAVDPVS